MVTLEQVRGQADPSVFPRHVLDGCETGLVLFAAGFHGCQDAIWLAEAGIQATCVDLDIGKLREMEDVYPPEWEYVSGDAFEYAPLTERRRWDVVTIDCSTGAFDRCAGMAARWCGFANRSVVLGSGPAPEFDLPLGWTVTETLRRSDYRGGVYWTVIEPY